MDNYGTGVFEDEDLDDLYKDEDSDEEDLDESKACDVIPDEVPRKDGPGGE